MPFVAPAIVGVAVGAKVAGFVGVAWGVAAGAVSAGAAFLLGQIAQRKQSNNYSGDVPQNTASPVVPIAEVWGCPLVAPNKVQSTDAGGDSREFVWGLGEAEIGEFHRVVWNDADIDLLLGGTVVELRSGDPTVAPPGSGDFPLIHAVTPVQRYPWTGTLWTKVNHENYTREMPRLTLYAFKKVRQTDLSGYVFTRNPANCLLTYLMDVLEIDSGRVDLDAFAALETHCAQRFGETSDWSEDLLGAGTLSASTTFKSDTAQKMYGASQVLVSSGDYGKWASTSVAPPHWIQQDFGSDAAVRIGRFQVTPWSQYYPTEFSLEGSNDASSWDALGIKEDGDPSYAASVAPTWSEHTEKTFLVDPGDVDRYRYYRLYITASSDGGGRVDIQRWKCFALLGGIAPLHRFDWINDTKKPVVDVLSVMGKSFRGAVDDSTGVYRPLWLDQSAEVAFVFTQGDILRGTLQEDEEEAPNLVRVLFRNRARMGVQDAAEWRDDDDIAVRGEVSYELQADWITDRECALREAAYWAEVKRHCRKMVSFTATLRAARVMRFDKISVDHVVIGATAKTYVVEDLDRDPYGRPTIRARIFKTLDLSRMAYDQVPTVDSSGGVADIQSVSAPEEPTPTRGVGSATITWPPVRGARFYRVETRLVSANGFVDSGWMTAVNVGLNTTYTFTLSGAQINTYGNDAQINFRVTAFNRAGFESEVSATAAVTILPPDGAGKYKDFQAESGVTTYAIGQNATPGTATLSVEGGLIFNEKRDAADLYYDFEVTESTPASGNYDQVELENELPDGAKFRLYFQPANNTYAAI